MFFENEFDMLLQFARKPDIIGIKQGDVLAGCSIYSIITACSRAAVVGISVAFNSRRFLLYIRLDYVQAVVSRTIVRDYQFPVSIRLRND